MIRPVGGASDPGRHSTPRPLRVAARWLPTIAAIATLSFAAMAACAAEPATESDAALQRLADLSAQRLLLADTVAASKRQSGKPVEDAAREQSQLETLGQQAAAHGLVREQATAFFKAQIEANKLVQYRLLAEPARAGRPAAPIDLAPVRERLDGINADLLDSLAPALSESRGAACVQRTDRAQRQAARRHRLDELHRIALSRAFGDLCRMP
ncbi:chorismate mutase [Lysobacter sp. CA199]|uniref:chorismate mutase n=1 Tax=Lysobacter sp. CA199 TaxID=3455608 RepID=UPI003F8D05A7